jgi:ElaB/YqjD/DUF883 family membrane-anchored ribosome-binding protein
MASVSSELKAPAAAPWHGNIVGRAKAAISDKIEDGNIEAKRLLRRGRYAAEGAVEQSAHVIRRSPMRSVALAFSAGMMIGFVLLLSGEGR